MRERRLSIPWGPQAAAVGLLLLWASLLLVPRGWQINAPTLVGRVALGAVLLWFFLNFIFWFVPSWRASAVERRGPLLGFGFAFAAALISAVVDGVHGGVGVGAGAFFVRLGWLSLPFLLPFLVRPSPYPHLIDLGVALYALLLPYLPGFGGEWMHLPAATAAGFFGRAAGSATLGPGHLASIALLSTYFCGARPWTAAPLDWRPRPGDGRHALRCGAWAALGAFLGILIAVLLGGGEATPAPAAGRVPALVFGVTVASLFEGMVFCALLQAGFPRWLPLQSRSELKAAKGCRPAGGGAPARRGGRLRAAPASGSGFLARAGHRISRGEPAAPGSPRSRRSAGCRSDLPCRRRLTEKSGPATEHSAGGKHMSTAGDQSHRGYARSEEAREIFSVLGIPPEELAYTMAAYSRSRRSFLETNAFITSQKAAQFLERFYFNYGHRSIADMAHVPLALENISILGAIEVVSEQLWDGQERSTRYQDFSVTGYLLPDEVAASGLGLRFCQAADRLFEAYERVSKAVFAHYMERVPRPEGMDESDFERTMRARAFDVGRYLLPLATNTSVGQITSARTLEGQISRLLSSPYPEVRRIGEAMRSASRARARDPRLERLQGMIDEANAEVGNLPEQSKLASILIELAEAVQPAAAAPTLVRYTQPDAYRLETEAAFREVYQELLGSVRVEPSPRVTLVEVEDPIVEALAKLLYRVGYHPFAQIVAVVKGLGGERRRRLLDSGVPGAAKARCVAG